MQSKPAEYFDVFLSHTWMSSGRWKMISLLIQSSWPFVAFSWACTVLIFCALCLLDILPMPFFYRAEVLGFNALCLCQIDLLTIFLLVTVFSSWSQKVITLIRVCLFLGRPGVVLTGSTYFFGGSPPKPACPLFLVSASEVPPWSLAAFPRQLGARTVHLFVAIHARSRMPKVRVLLFGCSVASSRTF